MPGITEQINYWDKTWCNRFPTDNEKIVLMNKEKMNMLISWIGERPYYENLMKLDVGCGSGVHHCYISKLFPNWYEKLAGIDLSPAAAEKARLFGVSATAGSFYDLELNVKVEAFLFLDSLEHFDNLERVIAKIKELAAEDYYIFGNIPLYSSSDHAVDGGFERIMNRKIMDFFFGQLGFKAYWQKIYGCFGYPYMVFEGHKMGDIGENIILHS